MTPTVRRLLVVFALFGLAAASTSLFVHVRLLDDPSYRSFCDVNATVSCTDAYLSRYGSVAGVPTALFGTLWFLFVFLLVAGGGIRTSPFADSVPAYVFVMSTLGLAAILYLAYAAFFVLGAVCLLCLATYVAVIGLFVTSGIATSVHMTTLPRRLAQDVGSLARRPVAAGVLGLFLVAAGAAIVAFPKAAAGAAGATPDGAPGSGPQAVATSEAERAEFERWYSSVPRATVPVPSGGAAVVIVKFTDFQCPSCAQSFFTHDRTLIARYAAQYPGAIRLIVKQYPLEPECNPSVPREMHVASCEAAAAVVMARAEGKADALEEWLFRNQAMLSPATVRAAATSVGGVKDFAGGYARALEEVKGDVSLGRLLGLQYTPTYYVNGVRFDGAPRPEFLDMAIAWELRKVGKLK